MENRRCPGSTLHVSASDAGLLLVPGERTARLVEESGVVVAVSATQIDDRDVFALVDDIRR